MLFKFPILTPQLISFSDILSFTKGNHMGRPSSINEKELIGKKFGSWTIAGTCGRNSHSEFIVKAFCICGTIRNIPLSHLKKGGSLQCKSCWMKKHNKANDLVGKKIGFLLVLKQVEHGSKNRKFLCRCKCGNERILVAWRLNRGIPKGCRSCSKKKHGMSYTKTYKIWHGIIQRCLNKNHNTYKFYGARGIKVCRRWLKFENFYADMGERPQGLQIDRINSRGNYEPGNCRWVTPQVNHSNRNISSKKVVK